MIGSQTVIVIQSERMSYHNLDKLAEPNFLGPSSRNPHLTNAQDLETIEMFHPEKPRLLRAACDLEHQVAPINKTRLIVTPASSNSLDFFHTLVYMFMLSSR